jgi:hypothetical protein
MRLEKARPETKRAQKSTKNVASANGEKELKPHSKLRPRPNPAYKGRKDARNKDEEEPKAGPSRASRAKATATQQSDIEEGVSVMTMKTKGNGKGRARAEEEENDVEIVEAPTKSWAKRKTSAREDSDLEAEETLQKKVRRKGAHRDVQAAVRDEATNESSDEAPRRSQVRASKPEHEYGVGVRVKRTKAVPSPSGSAQSRRMVISENEDEDGPATKKKKRKINIFGPAQEPTFAWGQMAQVLYFHCTTPRTELMSVAERVIKTWVYRLFCLRSRRQMLFQVDLTVVFSAEWDLCSQEVLDGDNNVLWSI